MKRLKGLTSDYFEASKQLRWMLGQNHNILVTKIESKIKESSRMKGGLPKSDSECSRLINEALDVDPGYMHMHLNMMQAN